VRALSSLCAAAFLLAAAATPAGAQQPSTSTVEAGTATLAPPPLVSRIEAPRPTPIEPQREHATVFELDFAPGKNRLEPTEQARLDAFWEKLRNLPTPLTIVIEGHADEPGSPEYRMALAARRAESLKMFLVMRGVAPQSITTLGSIARTWQAPAECKGLKPAAARKIAACLNPGSTAVMGVQSGRS
jgi:peptidoglycan-associated lipoprotein